MRILVVTHYFYPEEFRINDLCAELVKRGHEVHVLTGIPNYPAGQWFSGYSTRSVGEEVWEGVYIHRVPVIPRCAGSNMNLILNYLSAMLAMFLLGPFYCGGKYDQVFAFAPSPFTVVYPAIFLKVIKRAPLMVWIQDLWPESLVATNAIKSKTLLKIAGSMVALAYKMSDFIFIQSKSFIDSVVRCGIDRDKIAYLPNWAETVYRPESKVNTPPDMSSLPAGFRILFAGNIGEAQATDTIVEAAEGLKEYKQIQWIIVGDGRKLKAMQEQVISKGLQNSVYFVGRKPKEAMPAYFSTADVLLVTLKSSPVFSLTIPSKVQSYLACGKPILASLGGEGASIIAEAKAGIAVEPENPQELANAVIKLSGSTSADLVKMGENALNYSLNNFNRTILIDKLENYMYLSAGIAR